MMVAAKDWLWFGNAGHFICGRWCRFHLATQVGDVLVSTVGQYVPPRHSGGSERTEAAWLQENPDGEEIGCGRFYETMVFVAGMPCNKVGCNCGLPDISGRELDCAGYANAGDATRGHVEMCQRWSDTVYAKLTIASAGEDTP